MKNTEIKENEGGAAPANSVGSGAIAGVGIGKDGEPGVKRKQTIPSVLKRKSTMEDKYREKIKRISEGLFIRKQIDEVKNPVDDGKVDYENQKTSPQDLGDNNMSNTVMSEMFARCRAAATTTHFAHLSTDSFSEHTALGAFYTEIVTAIDGVCEAYIGLYGKFISMPPIPAKMQVGEVAIAELRDWIGVNRTLISDDSAIQNSIDTIVELCNSTIYKLQKLK